MEGKGIIRIFAASKHVLTIRVSFPRGQAVYVTTRLKPPSGGFLFPETLHQHFQKALTRSDISFDGNPLTRKFKKEHIPLHRKP